MRDSFVKTLTDLAEQDPRIMLLTGDLGFGIFDDFTRRVPRQFLNVGVAEQNMIGIATGLALEGYRVFAYSISNFGSLRCLEQIRNDACYHSANVTVVISGGGFSYGALGFSHHGTEDVAAVSALPNMTVVSPSDKWEASQATLALAAEPHPGYLRLERGESFDMDQTAPFALGKARKVREGGDITLIGSGGITVEAMRAAERLAENGVECRVLSMHTVKPVDETAIIEAARETGGILTVEEQNVSGGIGSAAAETCLENRAVPGVFYRLGLRDQFATVVGSQTYLRGLYGMDANAIVNKVNELLGRK